jgi:glycine cleavage system H lipoate-binding protein
VNRSPYKDGWMVRIRLESADEVNALLSAEDYEKTLGAHA